MLNNGIDYLMTDGVKMKVKSSLCLPICLSLIAMALNGCYHPPYNNFKPDYRGVKRVALATGIGAGTGAVVGTVTGNTAAGAIIGGAAGAAVGLYRTSKKELIKEMREEDIELITYGDTTTLIVATDEYFVFNSPHLNDIHYVGLYNIVRLLSYYPNTTVHIAAFTDSVGSHHHKRMLTQARAETMLTFLWANNIPADLLYAEGYGDKHNVADNKLIRGSAYNRRLEIQWTTNGCKTAQKAPYIAAMNGQVYK